MGGATGLVDRALLTSSHIYGHPTCSGDDLNDSYACGSFDPEGLLGALNSIVLCYLGLQVSVYVCIFCIYIYILYACVYEGIVLCELYIYWGYVYLCPNVCIYV